MRWRLILPKGVTGFLVWDCGEPIPPGVDPKLFKATCHAAAQATHAQIVSIDTTPHPSRNFHVAHLQFPSRVLWIMCNARFPFIAFSADRPGYYGHPFIDMPLLATVFMQTHAFEVLPSRVLEAPPTPEALIHLAPVEQQYARSWKARRIGDIIFNHWD